MTVALFKWTVDRYHAAIDAGLFEDQAVELLRGDIIVMAPEREPHACYSSVGAEYLRRLLGERVSVREGKPITLPDDSEPIPDVAIVHPPLERYLQHHPYPEDIFWLIEYSNATLAKDLGEKKEAYAEAGIAEYWVVNLKKGQLKVFRDLAEGVYQSELTLTEGEISAIAFQDVPIRVNRLFGSPPQA
jgi:Uma2 family endonuclease